MQSSIHPFPCQRDIGHWKDRHIQVSRGLITGGGRCADTLEPYKAPSIPVRLLGYRVAIPSPRALSLAIVQNSILGRGPFSSAATYNL